MHMSSRQGTSTRAQVEQHEGWPTATWWAKAPVARIILSSCAARTLTVPCYWAVAEAGGGRGAGPGGTCGC